MDEDSWPSPSSETITSNLNPSSTYRNIQIEDSTSAYFRNGNNKSRFNYILQANHGLSSSIDEIHYHPLLLDEPLSLRGHAEIFHPWLKQPHPQLKPPGSTNNAPTHPSLPLKSHSRPPHSKTPRPKSKWKQQRNVPLAHLSSNTVEIWARVRKERAQRKTTARYFKSIISLFYRCITRHWKITPSRRK